MKPIEKWLLAATLTCCVPALTPARADEAKVEVAGITLGNNTRTAQDDNGQGGTSLKLWVGVPGKIIVGANSEDWKFKKFTDDKGTDLLAAPRRKSDAVTSYSAIIGPGGKVCEFTVGAPGTLPAAGATKLSLSGTMFFRCGTTQNTAEQKDVALKDGTAITAVPVPFTISSAEGSSPEFIVTLKSNQPLERLTKIAFFDAAGEIPESSSYRTDTLGNSGSDEIDKEDGTYTRSFWLDRKASIVTVKVTSVDKVESVKVPVQVETAISLGG